jgi:hypothetical protein
MDERAQGRKPKEPPEMHLEPKGQLAQLPILSAQAVSGAPTCWAAIAYRITAPRGLEWV